MNTRVTRSVFINKDIWNRAQELKLNISAITEKALELEIAKIEETLRTYSLSNKENTIKRYRKL